MTVAPAPPETRESWGARSVHRLRGFGSPTSNRIIGVDVARGLAVLGMYGAHVGFTTAFDWSSPETWTDVVNGRASILFALLAGVSIAIISGRTEPLDGVDLLRARVRIFTRAVLIFALGGLLEYLGTGVAVILPTYAALFVLSIPFLRWKPRALFILAACIAVLMPFLVSFRPEIMWDEAGALGGGVIFDLLVTGTYPGLIWMAFVLAGLAIGRLDLRVLRVQVWLVLIGLALAVVGYGLGSLGDAVLGSSSAPDSSSSWTYIPSEGIEMESLPGEDVDLSGLRCEVTGPEEYFCYNPELMLGDEGSVPEETPPPEDTFGGIASYFDYSYLWTARAHSGSPFEVVGSTGFAMIVLGLSLLATRPRAIRWILYPVASVGAMALTAYSVHIFAIAILGGGVYDVTDNWLWLAFSLVALVLCTAWTILVGRGPLEQALTRISHDAARVTSPATPKDSNE